MIRIRKKKSEGAARDEERASSMPPAIDADARYVGAFPGKPWERLTDRRHRRGLRLKTLTREEQDAVIELARQHFGFTGDGFAAARRCIQGSLDHPRSEAAMRFFVRAAFTEKRIVIRAYLSDADGRFVDHDAALRLLMHIAASGLDFEVGAVDHYIEGAVRTEFVIGDGTEVVSESGYWFAHTHPAKTGVITNVLPSLADIDVMVATARSKAHNLHILRAVGYVLRDIGATRVTITTSVGERPSSAGVERVEIDYWHEVDDDGSIAAQAAAVVRHLRMRHCVAAQRIVVSRLRARDELALS